MKTTRDTLMTALIAVVGALSWTYTLQAAAQEPGRFVGARAAPWRERMRERMQNAAKDLNLTEDQKAKLKELYAPQREKLRELWQDQDLTREQKIEELKALRAKNEPKLKEILTPEQLENWRKRQTQARGQRFENARDCRQQRQQQ